MASELHYSLGNCVLRGKKERRHTDDLSQITCQACLKTLRRSFKEEISSLEDDLLIIEERLSIMKG